MDSPDPFESEPNDTRAQMLRATYDALQKHGYTDLTIQRIDEEFPKSKSIIYQHFDGKDELLVEFLELMLEHFESEVRKETPLDARQRLQTLLDHTLAPTPNEDHEAFLHAMTALRGQAPYDEEFQQQFRDADRVFRSQIEAIVQDGVESGLFHECDPAHVAEFVLTTIQGAMVRRSTTDEDVDIATVRDELHAYLEGRLGVDLEERPGSEPE